MNLQTKDGWPSLRTWLNSKLQVEVISELVWRNAGKVDEGEDIQAKNVYEQLIRPLGAGAVPHFYLLQHLAK